MDRVLQFAHKLIKERVNNEDVCVDMTAGNGHDTLFLAKLCKFVYAFDIQSEALKSTDTLLKDNNISNYKLILSSHHLIDEFIKENIKAFIFNLGYLPKGNKKITTNKTSTIIALDKAINYLEKNGIIVIVCYPGHEEGKIEANALLEYVKKYNQKDFDVITYQFLNQINNPPFVIAIERK